MRKELEINGGDVVNEKGKVIIKNITYKKIFELDNILIEQYINPKGIIVKKYCTIIENDRNYKANIAYETLSTMLRPFVIQGFAAKSISYGKTNLQRGTRGLGKKS